MRSCELVYIRKIKSGCGIAQLTFPYLSYFPLAAYVHLVKLIYLNNLPDDTASLLTTNQSS